MSAPAGSQGAGCPFCAIAAGAAAARRVLETEEVVAFLDRRPLFPGHVLLIPRRHVGTLAELPGELVAPLFVRAQHLSRAVERAVQADGSFVAINNRVSQSVPHLHVHIVPRRQGDGLKGFFWPRRGYRDAAHAEQVRGAIEAALREA